MAESTVTKTRLEGVITLGAYAGGAFDLSDGSTLGSANSYEVSYEAGDLSLTIPGRARSVLADRGSIVDVLPGDEQASTLQFSCYFRQGSSETDDTITDIAKWLVIDPADAGSDNIGANWESVYSSGPGNEDARVNGLSVRLAITNSGDSGDVSYIICQKCYGTLSFSEGDPDTLQLSLTCTDPIPTIL